MKATTLAMAIAALFAAPTAPSAAPFAMPLSARVAEGSPSGGGWLEKGVMDVTFVQAAGQFRAALAQSGWTLQHAVPIAGTNSRTLYTWRRGPREITLMLWRIDVGKTGFSWGLAEAGKNKENRP